MSNVEFEDETASMRVTRTFAFLDLCGFTDFVDVHGDEAAVEELAALRTTVRDVASRCGVRVDKWLGDGMMLVGVESQPLIEAVMAIEARTAGHSRLPLRGGVASGPVILLEGDDYVGRAVNLAARLCDRARAHQVLAAADLADDLPDGVKSKAMAGMRVRGFIRPVEVVSLAQEGDAEPSLIETGGAAIASLFDALVRRTS
jgi:class 3 adenylate cyclase